MGGGAVLTTTDRVLDNLNGALHTLLAEDPRLFLLGEDVADPYGGAFKVTAGLSTKYPGRVLSTPISENGIVGVANGLALTGNRAIVEMMFGDFAALCFDQILNVSAKSVSMFGETLPVPVVVRVPTGANRGYGPTHSQSLQKHFVGIPDLDLYELSPCTTPWTSCAACWARAAPACSSRTRRCTGSACARRGRSTSCSATSTPTTNATGPA